MIIILLKTCASAWQTNRQTHTRTHTRTHTHLSITFSCLQVLTLVPGPKSVSSGSERMLAKAPCLKFSPWQLIWEHQGIWFSSCHIKQKILLPWSLAAENKILAWFLSLLVLLWSASIPVDSLLPSTPTAPCLQNKITDQGHSPLFFLQSLSWDRTAPPVTLSSPNHSLILWKLTSLDLFVTVTQG